MTRVESVMPLLNSFSSTRIGSTESWTVVVGAVESVAGGASFRLVHAVAIATARKAQVKIRMVLFNRRGPDVVNTETLGIQS
jgi:hypothetical protein